MPFGLVAALASDQRLTYRLDLLARGFTDAKPETTEIEHDGYNQKNNPMGARPNGQPERPATRTVCHHQDARIAGR